MRFTHGDHTGQVAGQGPIRPGWRGRRDRRPSGQLVPRVGKQFIPAHFTISTTRVVVRLVVCRGGSGDTIFRHDHIQAPVARDIPEELHLTVMVNKPVLASYSAPLSNFGFGRDDHPQRLFSKPQG